MNETSPSTMLVPMFIRMDTPMAARNSSGSIHDIVDSTSSRMMMGPRMSIAPSTWSTTASCDAAVSADSPVTALPGPYASMYSRTPPIVALSFPGSTVTWYRAVPRVGSSGFTW